MKMMKVMPTPQKALLLSAAAAVLFVGTVLLCNFIRSADRGLLCSSSPLFSRPFPGGADAQGELALALLHYATTSQVPQQSRAEIQLTFDVLRRRAPCNFLVFGLGRDSQMWSALNPGGTTLFMEEDKEWYELVLKGSPSLRGHYVKYRTRLDEADRLLKGYREEAECRPGRADGIAGLRRNGGCPLALVGLPDEVYEKEWDVVMIDAPKGYFPSAPGRMAAIYSAAVMGRGRRGEGQTDVFLHDVDRKVEKAFALEFLCQKNRVGATGRLWHFRIPPVNPNQTTSGSISSINSRAEAAMGPLMLATGLGVLAGAAAVKSAMEGGRPMAGGGWPRCETCNGTGRVACLCSRWSDGDDAGCRSCAGSGKVACRNCGGSGTGRPHPVRVPMRTR